MIIDDTGTARALLKSWLPWWFQAGRAELIQRPIGQALDRCLQGALEAVRLRYPSVCPSDALPLIGQDRLIPRAAAEPEESYRRRLLLWLDYWALAGLPLGLLYAIQSYVYPGYPKVSYVSRSGFWYTLDEGASSTMTPFECMSLACNPEPGQTVNPLRYVPAVEASPRAAFWMHDGSGNWDYDSNSNPERASNWWDYWLIVYPTSYPFQDVYDTGLVWDTDTCWGLMTSPSTIDTLRQIVRSYQRAGAECRGVLFPPSTADFDPYSALYAAGKPDGWWGQNVRTTGSGWFATRRDDVRYVDV